MEATEILRREHDQILRVLHVAALAADRLKSGDDPPSRQDLEDILEFLRGFADGTHHAKEEKCLFPWMAKQGFPQSQGPLVCMNMEHEIGRKLIRDMAAAIDRLPASAAVLATTLGRYVELLEDHIQKENRVLFVMAERLGDGDAELLPAYAKAVPEPELADSRFQRILERLERRMGIPPVMAQEVG